MESKWVKDQISNQFADAQKKLDKGKLGVVKRYQLIEVGGMHGEIWREGPSFSYWFEVEEYCRQENITDDNQDEIKLVDVHIMNESEYPGICDGYEEYLKTQKYEGFTKKEFVSAVIGINEWLEVLEISVEA
jgi:hypothetical protein